jgi:hypothetical protein
MDKSREQFEAWWCQYADEPSAYVKGQRSGLNGYYNEFIDRAWHAWQASRAALCPKCGGTGMADSGGVQPWGEPIEIPCDCPFGDNK